MTTVFGNPGSTELPMLADFPDDFSYVLGLHETVAVGMADGFAQASGRTAMVNLHTAPGVGNGMGAIFNAQANKTPLLVTAGQQARSLITLQANLTNRDATRMPHPLVKWSYEPPRAEDVPHALARGAHLASLPPRGPVFVSIPMDDWGAETDPQATTHQLSRDGARARSAAGPGGGRRAGRPPRGRAPNPVFVAGPDLDSERGWDAAVALAERLRLPVWATPGHGRRPARVSRGPSRVPGDPAAGGGSAGGDARRTRPRPGGRVVGVPVLPEHPRPAAAGRRRPRGDHERSRRGRARADGRRAGGRPGARRSRRCSRTLGQSEAEPAATCARTPNRRRSPIR